MSLVEMLITLFILTLLSGVLFWMLLAVKSGYQASTARAGGRQDLDLVLARISMEMMDSNTDTVTNNSSGLSPGLSFLSAYNRQGAFVTNPADGTCVWQKYIIYYIPSGTTTLLKREIYGTFTVPLTLAQLQSYCNGQGTRVISSVTSLGLSTNAGNDTGVVTVGVRDTSIQGKSDLQTQSITFLFQN